MKKVHWSALFRTRKIAVVLALGAVVLIGTAQFLESVSSFASSFAWAMSIWIIMTTVMIMTVKD